MKLTPEERKQREIAKWEKEQKKSKLLSYLLYIPAMGAVMLLTNILGDTYIGICVLVTILPGMIAGLVLMMLRVKETKGVDMSAVSAE